MNSVRIPMNKKPYPTPPTHSIETDKEKSRYQRAMESWDDLQRSLAQKPQTARS